MNVHLAEVFWLALPVVLTGIAHMVVVKKNVLAALAVPIDGGRTVGGRPIFGPNKTWRGVVFMIAAAAAVGAIQGAVGGGWAARAGIDPFDDAVRLASPSWAGWLWRYALLNAVLGLGYVLGELPNSFLKRRVGITPGKTGARLVGAFFFVLDQADSVIAALLLGALIFGYPWYLVWLGVLYLTALHLLINAALFVARVRKNL